MYETAQLRLSDKRSIRWKRPLPLTAFSYLPASPRLPTCPRAARPAPSKGATQLGSAIFWTNRQKIRTPEQFSSTAKELYSTVPNATHTPKGAIMGKLEGKVAVITGGSSGLALASAKRFVEEGAYVFITGRRQEALDEAVRLIGRNVTGVRGDAANLDDLDRLFDTVQREKGKIDVLYPPEN